MVILALALHGMEDDVCAVNAQPEVFVLMSFQQAIIPIVPKGVQNIFPADLVLERGSSKLNDNFVHAPNLAQKRRRSKGQ
jgi:hypothetical protein